MAISLNAAPPLRKEYQCLLVIGYRLYNLFGLFDSALANMLCLETYRHGTSLRNYCAISTHGANPYFCGKDRGESGMFRALGLAHSHSEKKRFYVFKDDCRAPGIFPWMGDVAKRCLPPFYSAAATIADKHDPDHGRLRGTIEKTVAAVLGFFMPSLKFRFRPEDAKKVFQNDPNFGGGQMVAFTEKPISPDHLGITGTLLQGLDRTLLTRISKHPAQCALGIAQLVAACTLAQFVFATAPLFGGAFLINKVAIPLIFFSSW